MNVVCSILIYHDMLPNPVPLIAGFCCYVVCGGDLCVSVTSGHLSPRLLVNMETVAVGTTIALLVFPIQSFLCFLFSKTHSQVSGDFVKLMNHEREVGPCGFLSLHDGRRPSIGCSFLTRKCDNRACGSLCGKLTLH